MRDQVEEIKEKTDIVSLVGEYVDLRKAGTNFKGLCPFHDEKTPSFMVSPDLQIFKCFGCGESGDVYSFLQKYEGMEFPEALKTLAQKAGVKLKSYDKGKFSQKEKLYKINELALKFYHWTLLNHQSGKKALTYLLKERKLEMDTIKTFKLGYSPDQPPFAMRDYMLKKNKMALEDLQKAGLIYQKGSLVFDRFRGRVIFPLYDHRDNAIGFAGRIMPGAKKELAKYVNTAETPVYHKSETFFGINVTKKDIRKAKTAIITEGELDMISTWQVGIKNTVAIKGSALTKQQVNLLSRYADKIILALDADTAGNEAARKGIVMAQDANLEVEVAKLGKYKDPDDMAKEDPQGLVKALKDTINVWDFLIDLPFAKYSAEEGSGKAKISKELTPILAQIKDDIVKAHYIKKAADKLAVDEQYVRSQLAGQDNLVKANISPFTKSSDNQIQSKSRKQMLEERIVALAVKDLEKIQDQDLMPLIRQKKLKKILSECRALLKNNKGLSVTDLYKKLPQELKLTFSDLFLEETEKIKDLEKEYQETKKQLEIVNLKEKTKEITEKIKKYETKKNYKKLQEQEEKFKKLTYKLNQLLK